MDWNEDDAAENWRGLGGNRGFGRGIGNQLRLEGHASPSTSVLPTNAMTMQVIILIKKYLRNLIRE